MQERAHAVPFVNLSNIFPLHQTYFKTTCSFMHDFVNDLAPLDISELFSYSSEKHHHYTRSSAAGNLCLKYSRTKHKKNYFSRLDARVWNSIPICLLSIPKYEFKWYTKTATEHFDARVYLCWRPCFNWRIKKIIPFLDSFVFRFVFPREILLWL